MRSDDGTYNSSGNNVLVSTVEQLRLNSALDFRKKNRTARNITRVCMYVMLRSNICINNSIIINITED